MTINVTPEEVRAYVGAMEEWGRKRGAHIANWIGSNSETEPYGGWGKPFNRDRFEAFLKEYDAKNPLPRLFPQI